MLCRKICPPNQASKEDEERPPQSSHHPEQSKLSGWNWGAGVGVHNLKRHTYNWPLLKGGKKKPLF